MSFPAVFFAFFLPISANASDGKDHCLKMPEHCKESEKLGAGPPLGGGPQSLKDSKLVLDAGKQTLPESGGQKSPLDRTGFLTSAEIAAGRAKLVEQFPEMSEIISKTLIDDLAGAVTQSQLELIGVYIRPRNELQKIYLKYQRPNDPKLEDIKPSQRKAMMSRFRSRLSPDDLARFSDLVAEADPLHDAIMETGFHHPLMKADKGAHFFMDDPIRHDDRYQQVAGDAPATWQYLAQQALIDGQARKALAAALKALELDARDAKSHALVAAAQYELKDHAAAAEAARAALRLEPTEQTAMAVLRLAHAAPRGDYSTAIKSSGEERLPATVIAGISFSPSTLSPHPPQADALARQAEGALNLKDFDDAIGYAGRAIALDPRFAHAFGLRAFAYGRAGNVEAALKDAASGLAINPKDKMSLNAKAQALNRARRFREALETARVALEVNPRNAYARYMEAVARDGLGDRQGALAALAEAGKIDARYETIHAAALQVPADADLAFLFPDVKPVDSPAPERSWNLAIIVAAALAGGGLLTFAFMRRSAAPRAAADSEAAAAAPAAASARPGTLRGQYETLRQIGAGGMGMVYEGKDISLDRRVAIKKMRDEIRLDRRQRERFVSEAKLVAALHHPNIVDIYSIVEEGDELYLVFEYVEGRTLHELIAERGRLALPETVALFRGVAAALEYAHSRGIIHRDLKPSNIMIDANGAVKVMDFGIARAAKEAASRVTMTNTVVGTPPYMAPEQEQGAVRRESDVYALAVCLYEMLCGRLPFNGTGAGMLMNKVNKSYVPVSKIVAGLPETLDVVIDRALDPDPDKRLRTVGELMAALEGVPASSL